MKRDPGVVLGIDRVVLTVPDLAAAQAFYRDALGFERVHGPDRLSSAEAALLGAPSARVERVSLRLGAQPLDLLAFEPGGARYPKGSTSSDLWFQHCAIVVADMRAAHAHLARFDIAPISREGPQRLPPNTGSVSAYKFRDPFGHPLELLHFPPGVGDPAWQGAAEPGPFLGIDHTAIAIGDMARSLAFYGGCLGLRPTATSHNTGPAQTRLDDIEGDAVTVLALAPAREPPHLELLGYETGTRRGRPATWGAGDVAISRTVIDVDDLRPVLDRLAKAGIRPASPIEAWADAPAAALQDPDGHDLILRQSPHRQERDRGSSRPSVDRRRGLAGEALRSARPRDPGQARALAVTGDLPDFTPAHVLTGFLRSGKTIAMSVRT